MNIILAPFVKVGLLSACWDEKRGCTIGVLEKKLW